MPSRILVVDGEIDHLRPLARLLTHDGYDVFCTNVAARAAELLERVRFDALLCDLSVRCAEALQLLSIARARHAETALVLLGERPECRDMAGIAVIPKPVDYELLLDALPAAVRTRRIERVPALHPRLKPFSWLMKSFADAMFVVDDGANVVLVNDAATRVLAAPVDELLTSVDDYTRRFMPRDLAGAPARPVALDALEGHVVDPVARRLCVAGVDTVVRASAGPVRDADGTVIGSVVMLAPLAAVANDVTHAAYRAAM